MSSMEPSTNFITAIRPLDLSVAQGSDEARDELYRQYSE